MVASGLGEGVILALALMPIWLPVDVAGLGATALRREGAVWIGGLSAQWYWFVCLPVFRFLLLRWAWRLALWSLFLLRVARLDLHLVPIHPDRTAGLGYLTVVHGNFALLVAAVSAVISASLAEDIMLTGARPESYYDTILFALLAYAAIFVGPLFVFAPKLRLARARGLAEYMDLAASYVNAFQAKWLRREPGHEELLGTSDLQSLADLGNSVRVVEDMRTAPVSYRLLTRLVVAALVPMLPLLLFRVPHRRNRQACHRQAGRRLTARGPSFRAGVADRRRSRWVTRIVVRHKRVRAPWPLVGSRGKAPGRSRAAPRPCVPVIDR